MPLAAATGTGTPHRSLLPRLDAQGGLPQGPGCRTVVWAGSGGGDHPPGRPSPLTAPGWRGEARGLLVVAGPVAGARICWGAGPQGTWLPNRRLALAGGAVGWVER